MAYYTVYRPKDWLDELRKSDDNGPIKEKPLRINSKGVVLAQSLAATRRLSKDSAKMFEEVFKNV